MTPLTVVCFRWQPFSGYRSTFAPESVRILRDMVRRHYPAPHRFVCVTDQPGDIDRDIETIPLWKDLRDVPSPHGRGNPSCYRRLKLFSADIAEIVGPRFVSLDLDTVIVGDLRPVWDRPDDFVIWGDTNPKTAYNGSMVLMTASSRRRVWDTFDPKTSPRLAHAAGCFGSDQGWISYCLKRGEPIWTAADGVYSYPNQIAKQGGTLPANAKVVFFHGGVDPWSSRAMDLPWVRAHYVADKVAA